MQARRKNVLACLLILVGGTAVAEAAPVGYSVSFGILYAIDVEHGVFEEIGPADLGNPENQHFEALDFSPEGRLYGILSEFEDFYLVEVDPRTGHTTLIAPLAVDSFSAALAFDARGNLWMSTEDDLYELDPATGELTPIGSFERRITSLAARGGRLYAATWSSADDQLRLEEVDPATAGLTTLIDFDDLRTVFVGASFGEDGTLWLLGRGFGIPEIVGLSFYKIPDLASGEVIETFSQVFYFLDPEADVYSLALPRGVDTVAVPTLGGWSLAALAGLLGFLGLRRLRSWPSGRHGVP